MKNIFKYIAALVAFSAVVMASGLTVKAQNLDDGIYLENNGVAYAKRAIINTDGTYTIDLETFVTGEVTQTFEAVPVDVVLVLDVSGSMDDEISTVSSFEPASVSRIRASDGNFGLLGDNWQTNYYYYYNGDYRRVSVGRALSNWQLRYYLYFTSGGRTYYIDTSGAVVTNRPNNVTSDNTNLLASNVQLYEVVTTTTTKMDALKSAVEAFINQIAHNDWYEDDTNDKRRQNALGNQISIVKFAGAQYYRNGSTTQTANTDEGNNTYRSGGNTYNCTQVVKRFRTTDTQANVDELIAAVNSLNEAGATAADYGMNLAYMLIDELGDSRPDSKKTVVFFTDGEPNHGNGFDTDVATTAISNSKLIKDITYGTGDDATHPSVFSVGLFVNKPAPLSNLDNFMNYISSNYPEASAYNEGGDQESTDFYMDASGGTAEDLKDIFTAIAHASGGSGNTDVSGGSTLTVDVVSSSFSVPKGFEDNPGGAIEVLVAPCISITSIDNKDYLVFGAAKAPSEYNLPSITPSISEDDNKVTTTGFDYSANWCGPDPTSTSQIQPGYHGFKQIIRFVITVNDDAVGGPAVDTNTEDSGIYLPGATKPLIEFNRPTVKLPVQIWIQKVGLQGEDSAVFTLARTPFVENFDPETAVWEENWGTKIVIGPDDYDKTTGMYIKKQVGLNPDYYYRIKEDAWAFGYTYQLGGIQYTFGDNIQNPFKFENTPNNKKFDEATARNIFNEKTATSTTEE